MEDFYASTRFVRVLTQGPNNAFCLSEWFQLADLLLEYHINRTGLLWQRGLDTGEEQLETPGTLGLSHSALSLVGREIKRMKLLNPAIFRLCNAVSH